MNRSTPDLPVHHQLPEFTQTYVHRVSDAILCHPLLLLPQILYDSAISLLGMYPKKSHNSKRHMHPSVHCSTIYNSQDMERTQMSIDREM